VFLFLFPSLTSLGSRLRLCLRRCPRCKSAFSAFIKENWDNEAVLGAVRHLHFSAFTTQKGGFPPSILKELCRVLHGLEIYVPETTETSIIQGPIYIHGRMRMDSMIEATSVIPFQVSSVSIASLNHVYVNVTVVRRLISHPN